MVVVVLNQYLLTYILFAASAVDISHNAGKYDKDEEADDEIQG